jgi:predicted transcriptional regulator
MTPEIPNKRALGEIFNALSSEARIKALELFEQRKALGEINKLIKMSRSGFQKVVDSFRKLELIEETGHRSYYKLSVKGKMVLQMIRDFGNRLEPIEKMIAMQKIKSIAYGSGITEEDIRKLFENLRREKNG